MRMPPRRQGFPPRSERPRPPTRGGRRVGGLGVGTKFTRGGSAVGDPDKIRIAVPDCHAQNCCSRVMDGGSRPGLATPESVTHPYPCKEATGGEALLYRREGDSRAFHSSVQRSKIEWVGPDPLTIPIARLPGTERPGGKPRAYHAILFLQDQVAGLAEPGFIGVGGGTLSL